ncbi:hypothetical protein BHE74_00015728, partial [Ensete ventricosum]
AASHLLLHLILSSSPLSLLIQNSPLHHCSSSITEPTAQHRLWVLTPINGSNLCSGGCVMLQPQLLDEEDAQGDLHERHEQLQRAQSQQQRVVPGPPGVHRRLLRQGSALSEGATQGEDREQGWSVLLHLQRSGGDLPDRRNHERPGAGRRCGRVRASAGGGVGGGIRVVGK